MFPGAQGIVKKMQTKDPKIIQFLQDLPNVPACPTVRSVMNLYGIARKVSFGITEWPMRRWWWW